MVPVDKPKTNGKFASREKIRKWKTGINHDNSNNLQCHARMI
jgi:hypothetical protein